MSVTSHLELSPFATTLYARGQVVKFELKTEVLVRFALTTGLSLHFCSNQFCFVYSPLNFFYTGSFKHHIVLSPTHIFAQLVYIECPYESETLELTRILERIIF